MVNKLWSFVVAALFALSLAGSALADEVKGSISKVDDGGRSITVKAKDKEVTVRVSNSRTTIEGVGGRDDLKAGQMVTVEYKGDSASKIKVAKSKK